MKPGDLVRVTDRFQRETVHCIGIFVGTKNGSSGSYHKYHTIFSDGKFMAYSDDFCGFDVLRDVQ